MTSRRDEGSSGCGTCLAVLLVIALVVAAVVSVAALVDPFSWVPPLGAIFGDCHTDECALAERYPGFWVHVVVNFAYALLATGLLLALFSTVAELRRARTARFDDAVALERYRETRGAVALAAAGVAVLAAIPLAAELA